MQNFEYDTDKDDINYLKHGLSFEDGKKIWEDKHFIKLKTKHEEEERFMFVGKIGSKIWTAITTNRGDIIRIISIRRARKKEIEAYENDRTRQKI